MSVAHVLGLPDTTWRTKSEARDAYDKARSILRGQGLIREAYDATGTITPLRRREGGS